MTLIVPPGFSQCVLTFTALSGVGSKPTTMIGIGLPPQRTMTDLIYTWWHDSYRPMQDSNTQLESIRLFNEVAEDGYAVNEAGTRSGASAGPQVSLLVQKKTGLAGRTNRGRMYWPHVLAASDVLENGLVEPTKLVQATDAITELNDLLTGVGTDPVLFHTASSDPTPLTSLVASGQVATIRRRNRK